MRKDRPDIVALAAAKRVALHACDALLQTSQKYLINGRYVL